MHEQPYTKAYTTAEAPDPADALKAREALEAELVTLEARRSEILLLLAEIVPPRPDLEAEAEAEAPADVAG